MAPLLAALELESRRLLRAGRHGERQLALRIVPRGQKLLRLMSMVGLSGVSYAFRLPTTFGAEMETFFSPGGTFAANLPSHDRRVGRRGSAVRRHKPNDARL